jgi:hypothetical protein
VVSAPDIGRSESATLARGFFARARGVEVRGVYCLLSGQNRTVLHQEAAEGLLDSLDADLFAEGFLPSTFKPSCRSGGEACLIFARALDMWHTGKRLFYEEIVCSSDGRCGFCFPFRAEGDGWGSHWHH